MNNIVPITPANNSVDAYRMSTDAASVCKDIVVATSSNIQGRRYVSVEGWQAIAIAHGCAAGSGQVERVEGGVRAIGEVRRMNDGQLIATAEGFVGEDEPTWFGGKSRGRELPKRADYAIRAMAQTRAISRACRSAFAHVVVMMNAGLQTTPAEEVPAGGFDDAPRTTDTPHNPQTGEVVELQAEKVPGISKIKKNLNALMLAGNKAVVLDTFNELVGQHKDDLQAIKDGNHVYWTGDGEDSEGFKAWIKRRRAELSQPEDSLGLQMLVSALEECACRDDLSALFDQHGAVVEALDDAEGRKFGTAYDAREAAIMAMSNVAAG